MEPTHIHRELYLPVRRVYTLHLIYTSRRCIRGRLSNLRARGRLLEHERAAAQSSFANSQRRRQIGAGGVVVVCLCMCWCPVLILDRRRWCASDTRARSDCASCLLPRSSSSVSLRWLSLLLARRFLPVAARVYRESSSPEAIYALPTRCDDFSSLVFRAELLLCSGLWSNVARAVMYASS